MLEGDMFRFGQLQFVKHPIHWAFHAFAVTCDGHVSHEILDHGKVLLTGGRKVVEIVGQG